MYSCGWDGAYTVLFTALLFIFKLRQILTTNRMKMQKEKSWSKKELNKNISEFIHTIQSYECQFTILCILFVVINQMYQRNGMKKESDGVFDVHWISLWFRFDAHFSFPFIYLIKKSFGLVVLWMNYLGLLGYNQYFESWLETPNNVGSSQMSYIKMSSSKVLKNATRMN